MALLFAVVVAFVGCRDDHERKIADLKRKAPINQETSPSANDCSLPDGSPSKPTKLPHGGQRVELPGFDGCIEWEHNAHEAVVRFYVLDTGQRVVEDVTEPRLWLTGTDGPIEIEVQPANTTLTDTEPVVSSAANMRIDPGCWEARSPQLAQETPRGIVRLEIGDQSYRFALPTTRAIERIEDSLPPDIEPSAPLLQ